VREIPSPSFAETTTYLIPGAMELCTFQGEYGDVFANHRNKLRWRVALRGTALDISSRSQSLVATIDGEILLDHYLPELQGNPSTWPGTSQDYTDGLSRTTFELGTGATARTHTLEIQAPTTAHPAQTPIVLPSDLYITMNTRYATPQPSMDWFGMTTETVEDSIMLADCPPDTLTSEYGARQQRFEFGDAISALTDYWWPPGPRGISAGYTAPLVYFEQTTVTGIGAEPITLLSYYSQTYRPEHHNFSENFYFDFLLEPGLSPQTLSALEEADIRALVSLSGVPYVIGFDGRLRGFDDRL
jgi:hypothetical protein